PEHPSGDLIGQGAPSITVLANGHFVVASQFWRNPATGAAAAGAITWCDGNLGRPGQLVTPENSLTGSSANDWFARVVGLKNGNFVAFGPNWDNSSPPMPDVGAVVWCDGSIGRPNQTVSQSNALVGTTANDLLGDGGRVVALANGHYIVGSHVWDHPVRNIANIGAVLWCNGTTGRSGPIDPEQALIGTMADDRVGARGIFALTNGHYVVPTGNWNSSAGAVTWCDGFTGFAGEINPENSLIGNTARDSIGDEIRITPDGNYIAISELYSHNGIAGAGAVTYGFGIRGTIGQVSETNSVFGTANGSIRGVHYDPIRSRIFVGRGSPSAILAFRPTPLGKFQSIDRSPNSIRLTLPLTPEQKAGIEYAGIIPPSQWLARSRPSHNRWRSWHFHRHRCLPTRPTFRILPRLSPLNLIWIPSEDQTRNPHNKGTGTLLFSIKGTGTYFHSPGILVQVHSSTRFHPSMAFSSSFPPIPSRHFSIKGQALYYSRLKGQAL
ncbi:MAG: hypothetical protein LR011_08115, partial [Verrucomicrobia bacterium]|nr:hypothetical protein [Verrucomicrobiota bacterium]